jgi:hypothetical protein
VTVFKLAEDVDVLAGAAIGEATEAAEGNSDMDPNWSSMLDVCGGVLKQ